MTLNDNNDRYQAAAQGKETNMIETYRLVTIIICVALLMGGGGDALIRMGSLGYTSGYEGVKASFSGIEFNAGDNSGKSADNRPGA